MTEMEGRDQGLLHILSGTAISENKSEPAEVVWLGERVGHTIRSHILTGLRAIQQRAVAKQGSWGNGKKEPGRQDSRP